MPKVWDCFSYFCEKELLIFRIEHLYPYVDYFVITEADRTHQGRIKDFELKTIIQNELKWASNKIIVLELVCDLENLPGTTYTQAEKATFGETIDSVGWRIENLQRNWSMKAIDDIDTEDIIMIGDLDEFPNSRILEDLNYATEVQPLLALGMLQHLYFLNTVVKVDGAVSWWAGTVVGKRKNLTTPQQWRDQRQIVPYCQDLGFHFSWLQKWLVRKFQSTAHQELGDYFKVEDLLQRSKNLEDPFNRTGHIIEPYDIQSSLYYPNNIKQKNTEGSDLFYS